MLNVGSLPCTYVPPPPRAQSQEFAPAASCVEVSVEEQDAQHQVARTERDTDPAPTRVNVGVDGLQIALGAKPQQAAAEPHRTLALALQPAVHRLFCTLRGGRPAGWRWD